MSVAENSLEPPTLSEVVRLINGLTTRIDDAMKGVVTRYEYTADRAGIELKFARSEEIHVELKTLIIEVRAGASKESDEARAAAVKEVARLESKFDSYAATQLERRSKTNFLVAGAALTGLSGLIIAVFNRIMIGG